MRGSPPRSPLIYIARGRPGEGDRAALISGTETGLPPGTRAAARGIFGGTRFPQLFYAPDDTTRVAFLHGKAVEREAVYIGGSTPPYVEGQLHTLPLIVGPQRYREQGAAVGTQPEGFPPLSLDSLYGLCEAMLPAEADTGFVLELDGEGFLRKCGPAECTDGSCREPILLSGIRMKLPDAPGAGRLIFPGFHGDVYEYVFQ